MEVCSYDMPQWMCAWTTDKRKSSEKGERCMVFIHPTAKQDRKEGMEVMRGCIGRNALYMYNTDSIILTVTVVGKV